jgi:hypothetical protein
MRSFPYKPRAPRRPPEAPEPETPEQSDRRFLFTVLRIGVVAISAVPVAMLLVTSGTLRSLAALVLLVEVVLLAAVPRLRWFAIRAWLYWEQPFLWYVLEQDRIRGPLPRERDEDDLHRGDHLL